MSDVSDQWWSGYASAVAAPEHGFALAERLQRWSARVSTTLAGSRSRIAEAGQPTPLEAEDWSLEFFRDPAVTAGHDAKPVTGAQPSKCAAKGMKRLERQLAWLGDDWHVLHVVERSVDLDYILIGPAGVVTVTMKCVPNARARV